MFNALLTASLILWSGDTHRTPGSLTNLYKIISEVQIFTHKQMANQITVWRDGHQEITAPAEIKHLLPVA